MFKLIRLQTSLILANLSQHQFILQIQILLLSISPCIKRSVNVRVIAGISRALNYAGETILFTFGSWIVPLHVCMC